MTRYLLDTNHISVLVHQPGSHCAQRVYEAREQIFTSVIVIAEIRFGLAKSPSRRLAELTGPILESIVVEPWSQPADDHYGRIRAELERKGMPIGANDLFIAAHALALDATLVTANEREFRRVPGLRVENWAA